MGMFDSMRYDGHELQTKELDCFMSRYWIDPAGYLWKVDYSGTSEIVRETPATGLWPLKRVPTGEKGRVKHVPLTGSVRAYNGDGIDYDLIFFKGRLVLVLDLSTDEGVVPSGSF